MLPQIYVSNSAIVICFSVIGTDCDGFIIVDNCFFMLAQTDVRQTTDNVGIGNSWVQTDGFAAVLYRLFILLQTEKRQAAIVVGLRKPFLNSDRLVEVPNGPLNLAWFRRALAKMR